MIYTMDSGTTTRSLDTASTHSKYFTKILTINFSADGDEYFGNYKENLRHGSGTWVSSHFGTEK